MVRLPPGLSTLLQKQLAQIPGLQVLLLAVTIISPVLHLGLSPDRSGNTCKDFFFVLELLSVFIASQSFEPTTCQVALTRNRNCSEWLWLHLKDLVLLY